MKQSGSAIDLESSLVGHYAGAVTRFAAFVVDGLLSVGAFEIGAAGFVWMVNLFARTDLHANDASLWWIVPLTVWLFIYYWYSYWLSGKTPGKALFGLRVVAGDGSPVRGGRAAIRVLAFPLSWMFFGLGFVGIVLGSRRRALHDVLADTAVVYDYDAQGARLRLLGRHPTRSRTAGEQSGDTAPFTTAG